MKAVEFLPLSETLKECGKTRCLFCNAPATHAANFGISEIRCCADKTCMESAELLARAPYIGHEHE